MLNILLLLVLLGLYLIYKKLDQMVGSQPKDGFRYKGQHEDDRTLKGWVEVLAQHLYKINTQTQSTHLAIQADNPAGSKTHEQLMKQNLIKIYTHHLVKEEKLNEKDALLRARFEVTNLDIDRIIDDINRSTNSTLEDKAEQDFLESSYFEKEVKEDLKNIAPYYVFAPVWAYFTKGNPEQGEIVGIDTIQVDLWLHEYVQQRAIVRRLEGLDIIKKVEEKNKNFGSWNKRCPFKFIIHDLDKIKDRVYEGKESHDEDFFEERYQKGEIKDIFVRPWF